MAFINYTKPKRLCTICLSRGKNIMACRYNTHRWANNKCALHYRILIAQFSAKQNSKLVPDLETLEQSVPENMVCPICKYIMILHHSEGSQGAVMSMQHWENGTVSWICSACNARHNVTECPIDKWKFIDDPINKVQWCQQCKTIKPWDCFGKGSNKNGLSAYCVDCKNYYQQQRLSKLISC